MSVLSVATTINPRFDHVTPIESTRSDVTITHRCHIFAEVMAVARSGLVDIVLIADDFELVSLETLQQIKGHDGHGPKLAAISDVVDDRLRLTELGIPVTSPQLSGAELVSWLVEVYAHNDVPAPPSGSMLSSEELQVLADLDPDAVPKRRRGRRAAPYDPAKDGSPRQIVEGKTANDEVDFEQHRADIDVVGEASPQVATAMPGNVMVLPPDDDIPWGNEPTQSVENEPPPEAVDRKPGHITAVWGPMGSPGSTTIAVNLAVEAALIGHRTLLIDADTYGAAVAVHLGLLDDTAAIAQASRAAEHRGLDTFGLAAHTQRITIQGAKLDVITGLTRSERWPQVRAAAWAQVLEVAQDGWDVIIIDCGFGLEEDEELSFDIPAPQRNATTITAVTRADTVIAVGTGDPVGFVRFMRGVEHLMEITQSPIVPIINKVTPMTSGIGPKRQLRGVWERFGPKISLQQFIGWAPEVTAAALLNGKTLAENAPKAEIRMAIRRLMEACVPSLAATMQPSKQRSSAQEKTRGTLLKFTTRS